MAMARKPIRLMRAMVERFNCPQVGYLVLSLIGAQYFAPLSCYNCSVLVKEWHVRGGQNVIQICSVEERKL